MAGIQIYIQQNEEKLFRETKEEIRQLWYRKNGETISFSTVLVKSLIHFRDFLKSEDSSEASAMYDSKRKDLYKYERIRK